MIYRLRDELVCVAKVVPRLRQLPVTRELDENGAEVERPKRRQKSFFEHLAVANSEDNKTRQTLEDLGRELTQQILAFLTRWENSFKKASALATASLFYPSHRS